MSDFSSDPTKLTSLEVAGVPTMGMSGIPATSGSVWFVDSVHGSAGGAGTADDPLATITQAQTAAVAGDVVVMLSGHAETVAAAGGITLSKAGITYVGLGNGTERPTFTFATLTTAAFLITGADISMSNFAATTSVDQIVSPFVVSGSHVAMTNWTWFDGSAVLEALRAVLTTATANDFLCDLTYHGYTTGTHGVNGVRLVGGRNPAVNINYYGKVTTAVVEFVTTAVVDAQITGQFYVSGTTDLSKNVVDTVTGSTWTAIGFDGAAGLSFDGGSGKAISGNDVSTVIADLAVPTADATTNLLARDVTGNKTDASVTAVTTTKSLMGYVKGAISMLTVGVADAVTNAFASDVIGNKTDASVYLPATTKSLLAYLKGNADLQENVVVSATATMVNGNTLFTVAGGPIEIVSLVSICATANDGTASTLQYQSTGTLGATTQTISGASAVLTSAAAGTTVILQGTALATAPLVNANAANIVAVNGSIVVPAGLIKAVIGTGSTTGTWTHFLRYRPLAKGVTVS